MRHLQGVSDLRHSVLTVSDLRHSVLASVGGNRNNRTE